MLSLHQFRLMTSNGFGILLILVERIKIDIAQTWIRSWWNHRWDFLTMNELINWYDNEESENLNEPSKELKMKVAKAQFTGKNWKMKEDTWGDLDTWERRDRELIRGYLNDAPEEFENESWKLRMNNSEMMSSRESNWKDSWIAQDGWKEFSHSKQLWEDGNKLEPWIFKRMDKI